ncbi:MAG: hypothetical protein ABFS56_31700 [Pseudomonadota bacterium]
MRLGKVIAKLASNIELQVSELTPHQQLLIYILKGTPLYVKCRRLDLWENAYKDIWKNLCQEEQKEANHKSRITELINLVFELGDLNLYCAFDRKETHRAYKKVKAKWAKLDLPTLHTMNFTDW